MDGMIYGNCMLHAGHGIALYRPNPVLTMSAEHNKLLEGGVQLGDIGRIEPDGYFHTLFNSDSTGKQPESLRTISTNERYFEKGTRIDQRHFHTISSTPPSYARRFTRFKSLQSRCVRTAVASLILPEGALELCLVHHEELATPPAIASYIQRIKEQHRFFLGPEERNFSIVTRVVKCRASSMGCAQHVLRFLIHRKGSSTMESQESTSDTFSFPPSPQATRCSNTDVQCVFVEGYLVTLALKGKYLQSKAPSRHSHLWRSTPKLSLTRQSTLGPQVEHLDNQFIHPSDIVNQYLLRHFPTADLAVTHDRQWMELKEEAETDYTFIYDRDEMAKRLKAKYRLNLSLGVASVCSN
jgi:hypothetical protein